MARPMRVAWRAAAVAVVILTTATAQDHAAPAVSVRLPDDVPPVMMAWFLSQPQLGADNYKPVCDMIARHSDVNVLTTSIRAPHCEVTDEAVHRQIKAIAAYARRQGIRIVMDLDVRLARAAFAQAYPDEQQEMLRLREVDLQDSGEVSLSITSPDLSDHYTSRTTHYIPLAGRVVRVYSYVRKQGEIDPETVQDITRSDRLKITADAKAVVVRVRCGPATRGRTMAVLAAFRLFTPAVFAPHLLDFQARIIRRYADTAVVGACKDEWGFPPCYDGCPAKNDYWYSQWRAEAYRKRTGGHDLVRDCLLMTCGERGRRAERQAAINHFLRLSTERNARIERHFYQTVKEVFGPSGIVATHPTWYPYPGLREFKKNGLDWWQAPRDLAQTDEVTPYCVRTALSKKWNSPLWWNMYYSNRRSDYDVEVWSSALAGGRINYHPIYPRLKGMTMADSYRRLLGDGLMRADCRIRMLNFITRSPLDCPVAVVFGHACAMNWAGPAYDDVGIDLTDRLWRAGYPADLIPSSEIADQALRVDDAGYIRYGPQRYRAAVLYHPEFEQPAVARFFARASQGKTLLYRVGDWSRDFDGKPFDGNQALPRRMRVMADAAEAARAIVQNLQQLGVPRQFQATRTLTRFGRRSAAPPNQGECRLIDGTLIRVAGRENVADDPIHTRLDLKGHAVTVDAIGIVAVRLAADGTVEAMAAGGVTHFEGPGLAFDLPQRVDLALWRAADGRWRGAIQGQRGSIPPALRGITGDWLRLALPQLLQGPDRE